MSYFLVSLMSCIQKKRERAQLTVSITVSIMLFKNELLYFFIVEIFKHTKK